MWLAFYFIRQHCLTHFLVSIILLCYKLDLYHSLLWSSWTGFQYFWNRTASLCSFIMQLKCCSFQLYNSSCKTSLNSLPWFRTPLNLFHHLYPTLHPVPTLNSDHFSHTWLVKFPNNLFTFITFYHLISCF